MTTLHNLIVIQPLIRDPVVESLISLGYVKFFVPNETTISLNIIKIKLTIFSNKLLI